jgi:hypothetical protein
MKTEFATIRREYSHYSALLLIVKMFRDESILSLSYQINSDNCKRRSTPTLAGSASPQIAVVPKKICLVIAPNMPNHVCFQEQIFNFT